jgi:perosamine synthetase
MIPIYKPYLPTDSLSYAHDAINSGWISSLGEYKNLAANSLSKKLGIKHALLVSNGTVATHLLIKGIRFFYPNANKIIVPNNSYVAAYNSIIFDGDSHFEIFPIDSNLSTWNADYSNLPLLPDKNTVFLIVHNLGNIVNVPKLKEKFPSSIFIEDNCEGIFGEYEGRSSGSDSFCSSLSFFGNKNITTGEGGAVLTNNSELFQFLNKIHGQGQTSKRFVHDVLGYNYRMTNIHAAILLGQLNLYEEIKQRKVEIFNLYRSMLTNLDGIEFQNVETGCSHSMWMFGIKIKNNASYEDAKSYFDSVGIETRPMFYPISAHNHLSHISTVSTNSELLSNQCIILPSYPGLKEIEIEYICDMVKRYVQSLTI